MMNSLWIAKTGMTAQQTQLDVISHNLANVSTTGFKRNFDAKNNSFASHWQALGVGCQSCHGPASGHLAWAEKGEQNASAKGFEQPLLSKTDNRGQVQVCARCHALRSPLGDGYQHSAALLDDYLPSDLTSTQYEVDGRIKGEVFEYGSFTQSKMFAKGVACTNCHNPHSTKLKLEGNAVCTQCHNPAGKTAVPGVDGAGLQARDYDSPAHTHHPAGSAAAKCTACHMTGKFYMGNDFRHDHSFSVPNPAQSAALGTPDACQGCHRETKSARLIEQFNAWYPDAKPHDGGYAVALDAARRGSSGAARGLLTQLQRTDLPALRRAALLTELASYPSAPALNQISSALKDPDPQVREAAVRALPGMAAPQQIGEIADVAQSATARNHQPRTPAQRAENLLDGEVESDGGHLQHRLCIARRIFAGEPDEVLCHRGM